MNKAIVVFYTVDNWEAKLVRKQYLSLVKRIREDRRPFLDRSILIKSLPFSLIFDFCRWLFLLPGGRKFQPGRNLKRLRVHFPSIHIMKLKNYIVFVSSIVHISTEMDNAIISDKCAGDCLPELTLMLSFRTKITLNDF